MKRIFAIFITMAFLMCGCTAEKKNVAEKNSFVSVFENENRITISDEKIELNGKPVGENGAVFVSRDIIYYQEKEVYESGNPYGEGDNDDMHAVEEAKAHQVINITKSGSYRISGTLSAGQIRVDLGKDADKDPNAVVELILDNADITCTVAPAILFMNVYECDGDWSSDNASFDVDTSKAGAVLVLADGSENNISGSYVEKIFKDKDGEKKLWKQDGAIYSYMSMNVFGGGTLNLISDNEGLDTELHLTINGGNINIYSENDGINTNEDGVSVTTVNGGNIKIIAGLGSEGDGIDSNGWIVINGGSVTSCANPISDSGLDSDMGTYVNGGTVISLGSPMNIPKSDSGQVVIALQFAQQKSPESEVSVKDSDGKTVFEYKSAKEEMTAGKIRDYQYAVISSPELQSAEEYTLYIDGIKQGYTGTGFRGGLGGEPPIMPDGEFPEPPEGIHQTPPKGEKPPRPMENMNEENAEQKSVFSMVNKVNCFSGVSEINN